MRGSTVPPFENLVQAFPRVHNVTFDSLPLDGFVLLSSKDNARTHSAEQLNKLRSSLREFGFINPVIIAKGRPLL